MHAIRDLAVPITRISPPDRHCFFGYYDLLAFSADGAYHLCHTVDFMDRLPAADDIARLGMIRLSDHAFLQIAETNAWNFQQGAMLQWHPLAPNDEVIFNRCADGRYIGVVYDIHTGTERLLSRPVANVDPTGRYALSINFSRMFDFRPGYGYVNLPDPVVDVDAPDDDGVFLIDLASGESRLILSLAEIAHFHPEVTTGRKLCVNHITFNTDGTRFMFLARYFPTKEDRNWGTATFTANLSGRDCYCLNGYGYTSHYHWRDPQHLLMHSDAGGPWELYLLTDHTHEIATIDPAYFVRDGHCSYSPDRNWLLYDSYPIDDYRNLYLYDMRRHDGHTLGAFYSPMPSNHDIRCDLHPRWDRTGKQISIDSIHGGFRGVYVLDVGEIVG